MNLTLLICIGFSTGFATPTREEANVTFISWNLGQNTPTLADCSFLRKHKCSSIIALGLQEVSNLKIRTQRNRLVIQRKILKALKQDYKIVHDSALGSTQLIILLQKKSSLKVRNVHCWEVACGLGNVFYNKGAVGTILNIEGRRVAFITSHLAAHQRKVSSRNSDYHRIMKETHNSLGHHLEDIDCVMWGGDLNYRLNLEREEVDLAIADGSCGLEELLHYDQLNIARSSRDAFSKFQEGSVQFPPTYKFDKRCNTYDTSPKRRIPAWTDRVLYHDQSKLLTLKAYDAVMTVKHSDHRPVFARFSMKLPRIKFGGRRK